LLLEQEEDRVKKIARVAYRQQENGGEEGADNLGFQEFFKKQMHELEQNRLIAQETHLRNHA
jgi:hypothetical protein